MEKGMDATWGGCKYNSYGGTATGLATIADCLTTIKYMCFDKKLVTTRELYDAVQANWEGYEPLRQRILNEVPHYGNGDPYADMEMKWICDTYYDACKECSSMRCTNYKAGLYGASDHVTQGLYHLGDAGRQIQGRAHRRRQLSGAGSRYERADGGCSSPPSALTTRNLWTDWRST